MNISLQEWTEETHAARVPILNNPDVYRFLAPGLPIPYTLADSFDYLEVCRKEHRNDLAVVVDGEPVGSVGLHPRPDPTVAELGYYLDPARHRQGIMSRAVELMLARVTELMPSVQRVTAHVFDFNPASQALLRHCGFTLTDKVLLERGRDGLEHRILIFERNVARVGKVTLEPWTEENAEARVPILNNPQVRRYMSTAIPFPYTMQDSLDFLDVCRKKGIANFAVAVDGTVVGGIGLEIFKDPLTAVLGYYLDPAWHRRGVMGQAVPMALARVPELLPEVQRIIARIFEPNIASQALARHCGFSPTEESRVLQGFGGKEYRALVFARPVHLP